MVTVNCLQAMHKLFSASPLDGTLSKQLNAQLINVRILYMSKLSLYSNYYFLHHIVQITINRLQITINRLGVMKRYLPTVIMRLSVGYL